jgi:hypothetical protein
VIVEDYPDAVDVLAHEMVILELKAQQAELAEHYATAERLWRQRDDIRHQRSLLLRQLWRLGTYSHLLVSSGA